ncbi:MAG: hypothetical protein H7039_18115, partial [Bryobacteraceae bacterium]|nr:hypothetical protein [Bryobacteraceae bacterium]
MSFARLVPVLQHFPGHKLADVDSSVRAALRSAEPGTSLAPGARIAIGVGSRGIANLSTIVRSTVSHFQELGFQPFVIPAMGSHGGGTAEGQLDVLARYGVTEAGVGCPVLSSLEIVSLGRTAEGIETWMDR